MLLRAVVLTTFISLAGIAPAQEIACTCSDPAGTEISYQFPPSVGEMAEEYLWEAKGCSKGVDKHDGREKIFVATDLVHEDNPSFGTWPTSSDDEWPILYNGQWFNFDELEAMMRDGRCDQPTS